MRFMMLMIPRGYETAAAGTVPSAEAVAAMMKYNEALKNAGVLITLDGLHPPSKAVAAMMKYNQALKDAGVLITLDGLHPPSMGARVSFATGKPV